MKIDNVVSFFVCTSRDHSSESGITEARDQVVKVGLKQKLDVTTCTWRMHVHGLTVR